MSVKEKVKKLLQQIGVFLPEPVRYKRFVHALHLADLYKHLQEENVPGDIVECGVAEGYSLITLSMLSKHEGGGAACIWV